MAYDEIETMFERLCPECGGTGVDWSTDDHIRPPCKACNGTAMVPTEIGRDLLRFLERFHKAKIEFDALRQR